MLRDNTEARQWMIDGQLATTGVTDSALLAAMALVPREFFVPVDFAASAYADKEIPLGGGRMLMEPLVLARLVQALALTGSERVLIIGGAYGYSAAILAHLALEVVMVEEVPAMIEHARATLPLLHLRNITIIEDKLTKPLADGPAFDAMLIEGAVQEIPPSLPAQLKEGGRLAYVENRALRQDTLGGAPTGLGTLIIARRQAGTLTRTPIMEAGGTLLPGFATSPAFRFA